MRKWLLILYFLSAMTYGSELRLKDALSQAIPGSFVVTEQNKNYTLINVYGKNATSITLEEVTIPQALYARNPLPWRQWLECGAPGHTSWMMSQINLTTGTFEEAFSFTHQGWVNLSESDSFLTTLLNLNFHLVPENKRRRIGLPPGYNRPDYRPIWAPPLVVDGRRISNVPFSAWRARWPADRTELSRKYIEIYLPHTVNTPSIPEYPAYFPYWIDVEGKIGSAKVRIVDSGTGACSPKPPLPLHPDTPL